MHASTGMDTPMRIRLVPLGLGAGQSFEGIPPAQGREVPHGKWPTTTRAVVARDALRRLSGEDARGFVPPDNQLQPTKDRPKIEPRIAGVRR